MRKAVNRILLVNAGADANIASISNDGTFPALGVVALATLLKNSLEDIEVIAIDGQITPYTEVLNLIESFKPDVLGVSVLGTSYRTSLGMARAAKEVGATVIFGNDHAAQFGYQILKYQENVDFICTADIGEFAFVEFIRFLRGNIPLESVPQILYRSQGEIRRNYLYEIPDVVDISKGALSNYYLDAIPIPDRTLMPKRNWDTYLANYLARYGKLHYDEVITGVTTMSRARGCARVRRPCTFCGIKDLTLRFSSPEVFWKEVEVAQEQVNATIFYEAFDSMSSSPRWVEQLVRHKPSHIENAKFFVYTQAAETNKRLIELYKELGVYRVNIGLESGDTRMLHQLKGGNDSLEKNMQACILFKEAGIPIYGSLVLGGPGENEESLLNTIKFAKWLIDNKMMAALEAQPLYPDFGATTGEWLMNPMIARQAAKERGFQILDERLLDSMPLKYGNTDMIDFDEISQDWNQIFSHAGWQDLLEATKQVKQYATNANVEAGSARMSSSLLQ